MKPLLLALALTPLVWFAGGTDRPDPAPPRSESDTSWAGAASAQDVSAYGPTVERILTASVESGQAWNLLAELCGTAPHRLSGSEGAERAVRWARDTMERLGFDNVRLEPCTVPRWVRGEVETLRVTSPQWLAGVRWPIVALGGSIGTPEGGLTAAVVEVRSFDELEALGEEARGKIVFFNRPMDPGLLDPGAAYGLAVNQRTQGASRAARAGGVAALVRSMTSRLDDSPHTGAMRYDPRIPEQVPAAAISTRGAEALSARLAAGEEVVLHLELSCRNLEDVPSHNVVGELLGSERPEEIIVVGGHLDGWDVGQGAHDDGSGSCQSLEVVRLLKSLDLRPRRTIRVVLFMNEENGLRGAHAYHDDHAEEMPNHVFALESDRGGFAPRGFTCDAGPAALPTVRAIAGLMSRASADRVTPGGGGADVGPMARSGVITAGLVPVTHRYFDYHHSENDTLDKVHPRELNLGAGVMAAMCYVVADLPERLAPNGR